MARNVLVTGSSHGIGAAVAIEFAKQGDNVGITYLKSPEGAIAVQEECLKYGVDAQIYNQNYNPIIGPPQEKKR